MKIDKACRWVSNLVGRSVVSGGGSLIPHPGIKYVSLHTFQPSGGHLFSVANKLFLADLQMGLLTLWEGGEVSRS